MYVSNVILTVLLCGLSLAQLKNVATIHPDYITPEDVTCRETSRPSQLKGKPKVKLCCELPLVPFVRTNRCWKCMFSSIVLRKSPQPNILLHSHVITRSHNQQRLLTGYVIDNPQKTYCKHLNQIGCCVHYQQDLSDTDPDPNAIDPGWYKNSVNCEPGINEFLDTEVDHRYDENEDQHWTANGRRRHHKAPEQIKAPQRVKVPVNRLEAPIRPGSGSTGGLWGNLVNPWVREHAN